MQTTQPPRDPQGAQSQPGPDIQTAQFDQSEPAVWQAQPAMGMQSQPGPDIQTAQFDQSEPAVWQAQPATGTQPQSAAGIQATQFDHGDPAAQQAQLSQFPQDTQLRSAVGMQLMQGSQPQPAPDAQPQPAAGMWPQPGPNAQPNNPFVSTFETGRHYKVHKSYIVMGPVVALVAILVIGSLNSVSAIMQLASAVQSGELGVSAPLAVGIAVLGLIALLGLLIGLYALGWRNMSYVFDEREFSFYSGIITKRRVHVPYSRVQSVNHRASIVQRIVGVCTVSIDSAGGSANKGVRVPYLRLETAERLRMELFMRKAAVEIGMEGALTYVPHYDSATEEGAQTESAHRAHERGQAPVAPVRPGSAGTAGAAGAATPSATAGYAGVEGYAGAPGPAGAAAPGSAGAGHQAAGGQWPQAGISIPNAAGQAQANALDAAFGFAGDLRGLYGGVAFGEQPSTYEFGLSNRELLLTAISHDTPLVVMATVVLTLLVTFAFVLLIQDAAALALMRAAVPIMVGAALVTWLFGLITVAVSYGNFRARRRGTRIEVERGLLAREASGIDIARVQSIEVRQSFVRRLMGYCELSLGRIDTASEQNSGNNNSKMNAKGLVIHPFVKLSKVDDIIDGLAPEFADRPRRANCAALPRIALRRALLRRCLWYNWALWVTVALGACWAILGAFVDSGSVHFASPAAFAQYKAFMGGSLAIVAAVCALITVARGVSAVLWARHSGYTWNKGYLLLHNDGLSTSDSVIPRQKIQSAATRSNPFQRRLSLVTLQAITAAGTRQTVARLIDVPAESGDAYLDWAKPHGNQPIT